MLEHGEDNLFIPSQRNLFIRIAWTETQMYTGALPSLVLVGNVGAERRWADSSVDALSCKLCYPEVQTAAGTHIYSWQTWDKFNANHQLQTQTQARNRQLQSTWKSKPVRLD